MTKTLDEHLEDTKVLLFKDKNATFLLSLVCRLHFVWDEKNMTAATDAKSIFFNSEFYLSLPVKSRLTVLVHELWHVGRLHFSRGQGKHWGKWNEACDHVINLDLEASGYSFVGIEFGLKDPRFKGMSEEQVYNILMDEDQPSPESNWCNTGDVPLGTPEEIQNRIVEEVSIVTQAVMVAESSGSNPGNLPGGIKEYLEEFYKPVVNWKHYLNRYLLSKENRKLSYAHRNRRYKHMILPKRVKYPSAIKNMTAYMDVSGSVSKRQAELFNSEMKHLYDKYKPETMTLVLFDCKIQKEIQIHYKQGKAYDQIEIVGRGGTSLRCVRDHIEDTKPDLVVVLSDLFCTPMTPTEHKADIIWIVLGNPEAVVNQGKAIHIKDI